MEPGVLQKYFSKSHIQLAWHRLERTTEREVKDYLGMMAFRRDLEKNLLHLSEQICSREFQPVRPPKFYQPKASGMQRSRTILLVEDALVYQTFANAVATLAYEDMKENEEYSFGCVLNPPVKDGLSVLDKNEPNYFFFQPWQPLYQKFKDSVEKAVNEDNASFKFETDITGFFDSIPHHSLLNLISSRYGVEDEVLDLIQKCLNAWSGTRESPTIGVGIPQGPLPSFFLANLILHDLDESMKEEGYIYYRYVDDIRIYDYSEARLRKALVQIDRYLKNFALSLNAKKTSIEPIERKEGEKVVLIDFELSSVVGEANGDLRDQDDMWEEAIEQQTGLEIPISAEPIQVDDPVEIKAFCLQEISEVKARLKEGFLHENGNVYLAEQGLTDRDLIRLGYRFRSAMSLLREVDGRAIPDTDLIPYWLNVLQRYYWRTPHWCWILKYYKRNRAVKEGLLTLCDELQEYEWVLHHMYDCLMDQSFTRKELQKLFDSITPQGSWFAKLGLYKLLLRHSKTNPQFQKSVEAKIRKEGDFHLRKELMFWSRRLRDAQDVDPDKLMEAFAVS